MGPTRPRPGLWLTAQGVLRSPDLRFGYDGNFLPLTGGRRVKQMHCFQGVDCTCVTDRPSHFLHGRFLMQLAFATGIVGSAPCWHV